MEPLDPAKIDAQPGVERGTDREPPASSRALVVDGDPRARENLCRALAAHGIEVDAVSCPPQARKMLREKRYDLLILDLQLPDDSAVSLVALLERVDSCAQAIVTSDSADFTSVVEAMRSGAVDFIVKPVDSATLTPILRSALERVKTARRGEARVRRLKNLCKQLNTTRLEVTHRVDALCNDLVHAYQDLAEQVSHVCTVSEFSAIIRQCLDVEELLRTTLEYFLQRLGSMNAAVFLPATGDEYTLGAYINYDCPRESADFLLDHLADIIPPKMSDRPEVCEFRTNESLVEWIGEDATWLTDSHVVAFSCWHDDECLAIFTLFRDAQTPFADDVASLVESLADAFAKQLALVIHVHSRHKSDSDAGWSDGFGDSADDAGGLAA